MKFHGCRVAIATRKGNTFGIMAVSIDNKPEQRVDLYQDETADGCLVYESGQLEKAYHTLTVRVTGDKNPHACGSAIAADAVLIHEC